MILAIAAVAALAVVGGLTLLMRRHQEAFALLAIFALPFRLPISAGGRTVNLLIPLYLVVAAGTLAYLVLPWLLDRRERTSSQGPYATGDRHDIGGGRGQSDGGRERPSLREWRTWPSPHGLDWLLAVTVVLYAVQSLYSSDIGKAAQNVAFFYVPFGLLYVLLRRVEWTRELLLRCFGVAVALAVVFAGVGFVEYERKALLFNPKVVAANDYDNYFRVNSLFFDPSVYGRFLALVMLGVTTIVLWTRSRRDVLIGGGVLLWLLGGLITSFSQSSIAALLLGLAVLAAMRWDLRGTLYVSAALVAIAAVVVAAAPPGLHVGLKGSGGSASNATSGRTKLVSNGLSLFAERPLEGFGPGSFPYEYRKHEHVTSVNATSASHTIPVTIAAEQGIVGLVLYVALLVVAFAVLFSGAGRSPPRIAIAACFTALVLHTWTYADFLEDPVTWTLLGIGATLAAARVSS
ncbi:MAG TPA: O-antigen ligase family protein [Solirubrobacteraceae bacterium]|jgi:O-antigen ligase